MSAILANLTPEAILERFDLAVSQGKANPEQRAKLEAMLQTEQVKAAFAEARRTAPVEPGLTPPPAEPSPQSEAFANAQAFADAKVAEEELNGYSDPGNDPADEWDRPKPDLDTELAKAGIRRADAPPADASVQGYDEIEKVVVDALDILTGSRDVEYGLPERNLNRIAAMWTAYLDGKSTIDGRDVAWMMNNVKQSRDRHQRKRDNLVDGLAYVALAAGIAA